MKIRVIAVALFLSVSLPVASNALAADTPFGTAVMFHSGSVVTNTICFIYNGGPKPVTIRFVGIPNYNSSLGPAAADSDSCTDAPLQPDRTCSFSATLGVYGGGIAKVKGSTKSLRGECTLYNNTTGLSVITVPMR